jgi:hypothetical protein
VSEFGRPEFFHAIESLNASHVHGLNFRCVFSNICEYHRTEPADESEVLEEAAQQQVIDDIEQDKQKMARTPVVMISLVSTLSAGGSTMVAVISQAYFYLIPSIAVFVWIAYSVRHRNRLWPKVAWP